MDRPPSETNPVADSSSKERPRFSTEPLCSPGGAGEAIDPALSFLRHIARTCDASAELRRVYDSFMDTFARTERGRSGESWTPTAVARLVVETLAPRAGKVFDPCCGSGGMLVQSRRFVETRCPKNLADLSLFGQEVNPKNWNLANMNLAIREIEAHLALGDSFSDDRFSRLEADYVLAVPPFNIGSPVHGDFSWIDHAVRHLAPTGLAGLVLANGSMSSDRPSATETRKNLIEADLVDCVVALPGQLFSANQIPVCLWILDRSKSNGRFRNRREELLLIDARALGYMENRSHRDLSDEDIAKIVEAYHAWRGDDGADAYRDIAGFCRGIGVEEIRRQEYVLSPGSYVGCAAKEAEETFDAQKARLTGELEQLFSEARRLEGEIRNNLEELST